nr:3-keto-5-aminohexanoate cleavage protein [Micromonospora sp. DSM 115978]
MRAGWRRSHHFPGDPGVMKSFAGPKIDGAARRLLQEVSVQDPVVVEVAINGMTTKQRNPHVPVEPAEIVADALACFAAGAAIVHNHVDVVYVPGAEAADRYLQAWRPVLAERPDALLYPTTNGGPGVEGAYGHIGPLAEAGMRIGVVEPGSVNLGGVDADGVPEAPGFVYANSYGDIQYQAELCSRHRLGPAISVFEPGWLRTTLRWWQAGRLPQGAMLKLYFGGEGGYFGGATFGLPPTERALDAYCELLDGCTLPWSVAVIGGDLCATPIARLAIERGAHLHVGLEDYVGRATPTNVELVTRAVELCAEVGRPVASPDEAARIIDLPGTGCGTTTGAGPPRPP